MVLSHLCTTSHYAQHSCGLTFSVCCILLLRHLNAQMSIKSFVAHQEKYSWKTQWSNENVSASIFFCIAWCWCSCVVSNRGGLTEAYAKQWQDSLVGLTRVGNDTLLNDIIITVRSPWAHRGAMMSFCLLGRWGGTWMGWVGVGNEFRVCRIDCFGKVYLLCDTLHKMTWLIFLEGRS